MVFKLADFGLSKSVSHEDQLMMTQLGSPFYMSPQIHLNQAYTSKTDIFSLGVLFFRIYFNKNPWEYMPGPHDNPRKSPLEVLKANIRRIPINEILVSPSILNSKNDKNIKFKESDTLTQLCDLIIFKCL